MKYLLIFMLLLLFLIPACSNEDGTDTIQEGIDYSKYEDTDYKDLESVPDELKQDTIDKTEPVVKSIENMNKEEDSKGFLSTLKMVFCLLRNCWKPMISCMIDGECRTQLMSLGDCQSEDEDEQMKCFISTLSSPCDKMIDMLTCWGQSGCMPMPQNNCPLPTNKDQMAPVTLEDLEGDWYVVRGLSPVYDCWNCQRYSFTQVSETESKYDYTYFPKNDGVPNTIECTTTAIPFSEDETEIFPGRFRVDYEAYGLPGVDNWFCLSYPNSDYVLIYYCGVSSMHAYQGGIVLSRSLDTNIPQNVLDAFAEALANAGLSEPVTIDDLCVQDNSACEFK